MLSKEKCEKAIDNVARYCSDYKLCMIPPRFELINELDVLMSLIQEHFEFVELLKPHGYGMLSADEFERWINYICKHNADNDMIIMSQNEQLEQIKNPQPYKFEDLKELIGKPIFDYKYKEFYILAEVKEEELYKDEGLEKFMICSDKKGLMRVFFEEGRFFPVTKALEYQK